MRPLDEGETDADLFMDMVSGSGLLPSDTLDELREDVTVFNRFLGYTLSVLQAARLNPNIEPLQRIKRLFEEFKMTKIEAVLPFDKVLKQWSKLGRRNSVKLVNFIDDVANKSLEAGRRLRESELAFNATIHKLTPELLDLYRQIDWVLQDALGKLQQSLEEEAKKVFGDLAEPVFQQIAKDFEPLRNRNYFPFMRFGQWAVVMKAAGEVRWRGRTYQEGETMFVSMEESKSAQMATFEELKKEMAGKNVWIRHDHVPTQVAPFLGFSPVLLELLTTKLNLTEDQIEVAREYAYHLAPGHSFVKRLKRKKGIPGYSHDFKRAFASYGQHFKNHLARLRHRDAIEKALLDLNDLASKQREAATPLRLMYEELSAAYLDLMNPSNDFSALRAAMFTMFMGAVPKQAVVNLVQVPVFGFPYLVTKLNPKREGESRLELEKRRLASMPRIAAEIGKAYRDALRVIETGNITPEEQSFYEYGYRRGKLDQSLVSEIAAAAEGGAIKSKYLADSPLGYYARQFVEYLTWHFKLSEEYNRRVIGLAAYRLARQQGMDIESAREFAIQAVEDTMFEYGSEFRPRIMRASRIGRGIGSLKPTIFMFRMFQQNALFYAATGQGSWYFWAIQAALAGLLGLPLAEDLLELLSTFFSVIGGKHVDLQSEARKIVAEFTDSPDVVMHGAATESLGLVGLEYLFGIPIPAVDLSGSLSLGRMLPVGSLSDLILKRGDYEENAIRFLVEAAGASTGAGLSILRAAYSETPWLGKVSYLPFAAVRNVARAATWLKQERVLNSRGDVLVDIDLSNPRHIGEIIGQALGAPPARVTRRVQANMAVRDMIAYWTTRHQAVLKRYELAVFDGDKDVLKDAIDDIKAFNKKAPRQFAISNKQLRDSIERRVKGQSLRALGLPTQNEYRALFNEYMRLYQSQ